MAEETMFILLVEDDPGDAGLVRIFLERSGLGRFALTRAKSLAEMQDQLARSAFAVVLLDLTLPDSSGLDTVRSGLIAAQDVPVVVLTGHDDEAFALSALDMGAQDYLVKGRLDPDSLGRSLRHALARARAEREHARELAEKNRQLDAALSQAEAASLAKSRFLATMSHEVRTPLNAILGFSRILAADPSLTGHQADQLRTVIRSGEHLHRLLDDVLDMARMDSEQPDIQLVDVDLDDLLTRLERIFLDRASAKGLRFLVHRAPDVPSVVRVDPAKLHRILFNLLDNAVKFTPRGEVVLRVGIELVGREEGAVLVATVQDNGPGIAAEDREQLFVPFQQTESQILAGGTGLGLAISSRFAENMGGALTLEDHPRGQGCLFRLQLPLSAPLEVFQTAARTQPGEPVATSLTDSAPPSLTDSAPPSLAALPARTLTLLREALEEGDMLRFTDLLDTLPGTEQTSVEHLRRLARNFDYEALDALLSSPPGLR
ncbi:ATP-binding response regulator [Desulfonatronum thioautotrophicum]|uniref:ATP-binding response regulator n=1 Tax=Desulfonatronum thioautotrophicum TaxID=617001 RepID=UPI00069B30F9|nr:hybrid sensor histidine kinase/response regulator [Desulfonatronum thioautotrophicum]